MVGGKSPFSKPVTQNLDLTFDAITLCAILFSRQINSKAAFYLVRLKTTFAILVFREYSNISHITVTMARPSAIVIESIVVWVLIMF